MINDRPDRNQEVFAGFGRLFGDYEVGNTLLNEVQKTLGQDVRLITDGTSWTSSSRRTEHGTVLRIGEQRLPAGIAQRWKWGADTKERQYLVKVAHEYAHAVQEEFDIDLSTWIGGSNDVSRSSVPYIQLYALLSQTGPIHGLAQESLYHAQERNTRGLSMRIYEDMAEIIGSYLLSGDYCRYRLRQSAPHLRSEKVAEIQQLLGQIIMNWGERRRGR